MLTQIMKWVSMAALLAAAMLRRSGANSGLPQFMLTFVVCWGAGLVVMQAVRAKKYVWAGGFVAIALLFNPVAPLLGFQGEWNRLLVLTSLVAFAASLATVKTQPWLPVRSITDRNPGRGSS